MLSLALFAALVPLVHGHGYIKAFTVAGKQTTAQKTNIQQSAFRSVPDNTGWIGSNFLSSECMTCGCSNTPNGRVAAPGGTNFALASQSAGQTPATAAGSSVQLLVSGNPGEGWPHPTGHLQVYLGKCGETSCSNFDASTANYFKILSIPNGVPQLRAAYDKGRDGNPWNVEIPKSVPNGAYILRAEILAYGQSSSAEGNQVQIYPFCGQIAVTGGGNATSLQTVKFPQAYASDSAIAGQGISHVPGPQVDAAFGGSGTFSGGGSLDPSANDFSDTVGSAETSSGGSSGSSSGGPSGGSAGKSSSSSSGSSSGMSNGSSSAKSVSGASSNSNMSGGSSSSSSSSHSSSMSEDKPKKKCNKDKKPKTPVSHRVVPVANIAAVANDTPSAQADDSDMPAAAPPVGASQKSRHKKRMQHRRHHAAMAETIFM